MATYKEIQEYVKNNYGYKPKSCWIAHVKEMCGLPVRTAANRWNANNRQIVCPLEKQEDIRQALKYFKMI